MLVWAARIGDLALRQRLGLHFQIDFGVNIGRVERDMPEPGADGIDVHASAEQVRGRGMANRVRANPNTLHLRTFLC